MIKDCYVKLNNEYVTVIEYDGIDVQIPAIKREARTVRVLFKDGKYTVVGDNYTESIETTENKEKPAKQVRKTATNKKTTNKNANKTRNVKR
jgi:hypothetical protein